MQQPSAAHEDGRASARQAPLSGLVFGLLLAAILLVSAGLRLRALAASPLWWDEGNNAYFAHQDLAGLVEGCRITHDTDPPAHRLALRFWLALVGDSAYNLRLLSVVCGVATVALVYAWGRRRSGNLVGLLAALLAAFSPIAVYYSREAKGYPFATLFATLAAYLWAEHLDDREEASLWGWLGYVAAGTLALGAHYYTLFAVVAQGLWLLVSAFQRGDGRLWPRLWRWALAQVAVAAVLAPWVWVTLDTSLGGARNVPLDRDAFGLLAYAKHVTHWLTVGPHGPAWTGYLAGGVMALSCAASVWRRRWRVGALVCLVGVPIACCFGAQRVIPFFWARFLLYVTPALFILVAEGLLALDRVGLVLASLLVVAWAAALPSAYTHFVGPEEDLRPIAQAMREQVQPGDAVAVAYIWQEGILRMEAPGLDVDYSLGWYTPGTVEQDMGRLFDGHPRLWLITYRAPVQHIQNPGGWWLERNAVRLARHESGLSRAVLYAEAPPCEMGVATETTFGKIIDVATSLCTPEVYPGGAVITRLQWTPRARPRESLSVFMHLYDASGALVAQRDGPPRHGLRPFRGQDPRRQVSEWRGVLLPPDISPGVYSVVVGVYGRQSGERLLTSDGQDALGIGTVELLADPS